MSFHTTPHATSIVRKLRGMATYKLIYFNARGRAEQVRYIFAQAGVKYEDVRVEGEKWTELKPSTPYGVLPVVEIDGKMLAGSRTITRFVAEKLGLAGSNEFENAELDSLADFLDDFEAYFVKLYGEKDETRKAEVKTEITEKQVPRFLGILEKRLTPSGWIFGSNVTYIDFRIALTMDFIKIMLGDDKILDNYPGIKKLIDAVNGLPNIAKWISQRPETKF